MSDSESRRSFFRSVGVLVTGTSAAFLAACGDDGSGGLTTTAAAPSEDGDVAILNQALALEQMAVAAYTAGIPLLKGEVRATARQFLDHEQEHADGLESAIKRMGGQPVRARTSYDFPALGSQDDVLRFATDLENTAVAAYMDALPKLSTGRLRATAAAIVTNEAQHVSMLLTAQKKQPVPTAFVTGTA